MPGGFLHPETIIKELGLQKGMAVAHFGCGAGYFTVALARAIGDEGKVAAFDIQQSALESVRSRARREGLFNIEPIWADLETPQGSKLPDQSQDVVLLANILFQVPDKNAVLTEAKRVAKPQSSIVVIDWNENTTMGPQKERRVPKETVMAVAEALGLTPTREFKAGAYHYGIIFTGQ